MKNLKFWYIAFAVLAVLAVFIYFSDNSSTLSKSQIDFTLHNASEVVAITIKSPTDTFSLKNISGQWYYNSGMVARKDAQIMLFRLLGSLNAKAPYNKPAENTLKNGYCVSIYAHNTVLKEFVIAEDTVKRITLASMVGSNKVFEVEATGFPPRIMPFFRTTGHWWRDKSILKLTPEQLLSVSITNIKNPEQSFIIFNYGKGRFGVKRTKTDKTLINVSPERLSQYISVFSNIEVAEYVNLKETSEKLTSKQSLYSMSVEPISGDSITVKAFQKDNDTNLLYLLINENQVAIGKYVVFDLLFKDLSYFVK